jgi:adenylosuccinate synthase
MNIYGTVIVIMGMQYGSEGKGSIASYLSPILTMSARSGAANAGHTIYFQGKKYVMRQIPVAWINPQATLVIGVGSIISPEVLLNEIKMIEQILPINNRLKIDYRAHIVTPEQIKKESASNLAERISSTSANSREGIGQALADKTLRLEDCLQAKDFPPLKSYLADTVELINNEIDQEGVILAEGTQGFSLSVEHGDFPFCTGRDISVSALASSLGISTHHCVIQVIGVLRTYPIRVFGNSGPFTEDSEELTWSEVARRAGATESIEERTSVTNRIRRVATFSDKQLKRSVLVNRPTELALTFADYLNWSVHEKPIISEEIEDFINRIELISDVSVGLLKTGPHTLLDFDLYRSSIMRRVC